jgi:hypothetical protein
MATQYAFGKIVTNGLVLALDAADKNSYPGSGTVWTDLSGNSNTGTLVGSPTYSTSNSGILSFSGTGQYVNIPSSNVPLSNVAQFSYSSFVQFNTKSPYGNAFFSYGQNAVFTNDILFAWDVSVSKLFFQVNNGADGSATYSYNTFNTWLNIGVVYNGSLSGDSNRLKVYINGSAITLAFGYTVPATTGSPGSALCRLGTYASDNTNAWALNGSIANTLLYNRALSATEISQNYNAQKSRFNLT